MRADRLLSLLLLLQSRGRMTAQTLAEHLEVSERTIYRDIEALSMAGIPIYSERGPGGGCELIDGYQTRLTGLTESEVRALFLLSVSGPLADLGLGGALEDALLKLSAALPASSRANALQVRQRFYIDMQVQTRAEQARTSLDLIQEAIWQDHTLRLTYSGYNRRFFDPYGLVSQASSWYLVGSVAGEMHVLPLSRLQCVELTDLCFTRPADFDLALYWASYAAQAQQANRYFQQPGSRRPAQPATPGPGKKTTLKTGSLRGYARLRSARGLPAEKKKPIIQENVGRVASENKKKQTSGSPPSGPVSGNKKKQTNSLQLSAMASENKKKQFNPSEFSATAQGNKKKQTNGSLLSGPVSGNKKKQTNSLQLSAMASGNKKKQSNGSQFSAMASENKKNRLLASFLRLTVADVSRQSRRQLSASF